MPSDSAILTAIRKMWHDDEIVRALRWHDPMTFLVGRNPFDREHGLLHLGWWYIETGRRAVVELGEKPIFQWRARA